MSWSGLAVNQAISYNNLQDAVTNSVFVATGTSIPVSNKIVTKNNIGNYIYYDPSNTTLQPKASNQTIAKRDLMPAANNTATLYYTNNSHGFLSGWNISANACANYAGGSTISIYYAGSFGVGTYIQFSGLITQVNGSLNYFYIGGNWVQLADDDNGNVYVTGIGTCSGTSNSLSYNFTSACTNYVFNIYKNGSLLVNATTGVSGNLSYSSGDTFRIFTSLSAPGGHSTNVSIFGDYSNVNYATDYVFDSGTITMTQFNSCTVEYGLDY